MVTIKRATAALLATLVAGLGLALAASPAQASVPETRTWCEFPDDQVKALSSVSRTDAQAEITEGLSKNVLDCLEYSVVDKCDGTTVVTAVNWAVSDNKWTRLTFEILGKDYTVIGGPDHKPVVVTLGPPGVQDVQVYLVFEGVKNGTHWRIEVPLLEELYDWKLPDACPTASPTPSAPPTSAPATTPVVVVVGGSDAGGLATTGVSYTADITKGIVLVLVGLAGIAATAIWLRRLRRADAPKA
jgi:hypothetical protein